MIYSILFIVFDFQWSLAHDGIIGDTKYDSFVMFMYCTLLGLVCFTWVKYFRSQCGSYINPKKPDSLILIIPFVIATILVVATYWTDWVFIINDNGYARGPFFWLFMVCIFAPPVLVTLQSLHLAHMAELKIDRNKYLALGSFIIPLIFMEIMQYIWYDLPALCIGITISMIVVSLSLQNQLITVDQMTGLNNIFQMEKHLLSEFKKCRANGTNDLFVAIIDMDAFKPIAEKYGHTESAKVICMIAEMISKSSGKTNCFSARYESGNKFILISSNDSGEIIKGVCERLDEMVEEKNKDLPYVIHLSKGIAQINDEHETFSDLLDDAEEKMLTAKKVYYEKIGYKRNK